YSQSLENAGLPANKIVLGLPYYGYAWALANPNNHGLGAKANGPASGPGIDSDGSITYSSVRDFIQTNNAVEVYDATVVVNYCYAGSTWIGYDDVASISAKVKYAKGKALRGYFAWAVHGDYNWVLSKNAKSVWESGAQLVYVN
ncbi:acidic mammalian chitinase-like, partial [Asparagus officinalis]|uniref:acidic mammalian chitinase-like n=1 Tax=Asparagus officinalis TaxID=4686 RepID=UPI00098E53A1